MHHVVGALLALVFAQLLADDGLHVSGGAVGVAAQHAGFAHGQRRGHGDDAVERFIGPRLEEQRGFLEEVGGPGGLLRGGPAGKIVAHPRVHQRVELRQLRGVGKHGAGQRGAIELPGGGVRIGSKGA
ncbi:hypothetical protein BEN49_02160 [Hymenobacter coccineus]|uniref:Uncharacterized protein n=1 Tax=Hymenobacter coccineus TaxID=1908235 RepID=A0A1G1SY92_9BACT|nr:hypothetical protein BEN49_02160 [Hymenobacter coccineus]